MYAQEKAGDNKFNQFDHIIDSPMGTGISD